MTTPAEPMNITTQGSSTMMADHNVSSRDPESQTKDIPMHIDIEHMPVADDPRKWSNLRKNFVLLQVSVGSMVAGFAGNIQMPAVGEMQKALHTTSSQISLSLSLFILFQGGVPLIWSSISEVKGRKMVYLTSMFISTVGAIVVATANSIGLVIGFRVVQAAGSSAVMSIGAATLADIYDPVERGAKMGIYYISPLLGPSLGAIFGGVLTTAFTWRGPFYFLTILCGLVFLSFMFFKDTFRQERSLTYQIVLKRRLKQLQRQNGSGSGKSVSLSTTPTLLEEKIDSQAGKQLPLGPGKMTEQDVEKGEGSASGTVTPNTAKEMEKIIPTVTVSLMDVNPVQPVLTVLRLQHNVVMLFASGILFAFAFMIVYTTSRTLEQHYGYNPLKIGLVLLSYGIGCMMGSILGGRLSDLMLTRLKAKNGGVSYPEMRLKSTIHGIFIFPLCVVGFGWVSQQRLHVAVLCVMLFLCGFFSIFVYTSTLAYIVDANVGRSSIAVALNSAFRGTSAFVALEVAVPLQDGLGDGWTYTIVAVFMALSGLLTIWTMYKGKKWRLQAEERDLKREEANLGKQKLNE